MTKTMLKIKTIMDKVGRNEEAAPALAVANAVTSSLLDMKRTRAAYEKKVLAELSDEQQRKFAAWQKLKPKEKKLRVELVPRRDTPATEVVLLLPSPRRGEGLGVRG